MATKPKPLPTQQRLQELFDYNRETGEFIWKTPKMKGKKAGYVDNVYGYVRIRVDGRNCLAHRLAWVYENGTDPNELLVDHRNGNSADNRIENLRLATQQQNLQNKHQAKGIWFNPKTNKWKAQIMADGQIIHLGNFDLADEARQAYCQAREKYFGEFAPKPLANTDRKNNAQ